MGFPAPICKGDSANTSILTSGLSNKTYPVIPDERSDPDANIGRDL